MKRKMTGFTLIEMLVALVIAGILFAIASPAIRGIFTSNRMATHLNQISTALQFARSEAIKRVIPVAVGTTGGWASDWQIWTDDDAANLGSYNAATEKLLRVGNATATGITLTATAVNDKGATIALTTLAYEPDGTVRVLSGTSLVIPTGPATFTLCYSGQMPRILTVSSTGRPQVATGTTACP